MNKLRLYLIKPVHLPYFIDYLDELGITYKEVESEENKKIKNFVGRKI